MSKSHDEAAGASVRPGARSTLGSPPPPLPSRLQIGPADTIFASIREAASRFASRTALARRTSLDAMPTTFCELIESVRSLAAGLRDLGVATGDRVALVAENESRWLLSDLAVISMGAVDVPRGLAGDRDELRVILEHSGSRFAIVQDRDLAGSLASGAFLGGRRMDGVVFMGPPGESAPDGTLTFEAVLARGRDRLRSGRDDAQEWEGTVGPDDLATLVYTSGTTGIPKGVMLTHRNIVANIRMVPLVLDLDENDRFLSILPTWHMFERTLEYIALSCGAQIIYTNKKRLRDDLASQRVTLLGSVPRVWEALHDAVHDNLSSRPPLARWIARTSLAIGRVELRARSAARGLVPRFHGAERAGLVDHVRAAALRPLASVAERLVFKRVRDVVGSELRFAISGGASLPEHVDLFFNAIGVPLLNGYGLTETAPIVSVRVPQRNVLGTIGRPVPGTEVVVADADGRPLPLGEIGVIWVRGPQVMSGYFRSPEETAKVRTDDGWFNTGDIGRLTLDGDLCITGRAKDTIVLRSGENVEPRPIEDVLLRSRFIRQIVVVGQDRKTLGALVVPAAESIREALGKPPSPTLADLVDDEAVRRLVRGEIDRLASARRGFAPHQRITTFRLLPRELSIEDGTLTPTLKIKRNVVSAKYAALVDAMFREP
jgi:long-chain acyl-CoA synthetase